MNLNNFCWHATTIFKMEADEEMESLLSLMPEIKHMIGFQHNHPHHHLDVWEHTKERSII